MFGHVLAFIGLIADNVLQPHLFLDLTLKLYVWPGTTYVATVNLTKRLAVVLPITSVHCKPKVPASHYNSYEII